MTLIGYHASHEQHSPSRLLGDVQRAEAAGFGAVSSSDHLSPWSERQGESGFAWSWLGAAMQRTTVPFGVVNAPGQRYHPAIVAQAIATLADLAPDRLWVALGTGEASNEHVTGEGWPSKTVRQQRLRQCVSVIRALLRGEEVTVDDLVRVDRARLWTLPPEPPALIGAALSPATARWCGGWADGLLIVGSSPEQVRTMVAAFREGGGEGPVRAQVKVAWAATDEEALAGAYDQWRTNVFDPTLMADLERVEQFESAAAHVRPEDLHPAVLVSSDPGRHVAHLHDLAEAGADELFVHQVPREQAGFVDVYGERVLPQVLAGVTVG
jgi:probable non-F420 flavinoid oxidoreductase